MMQSVRGSDIPVRPRWLTPFAIFTTLFFVAAQVIAFRSDLDWATLGAVPEMLQTAYGALTAGRGNVLRNQGRRGHGGCPCAGPSASSWRPR